MKPIRVLVVDDSVVVRRLVSDALDGLAGIEVAGTAANGRIALAKLDQLSPDAVTLDIEMPELDGLATLRELRRSHPALPVVMFSTMTERGAAATLDALSLGANDYVTKPSGTGGVQESLERIRLELAPKLRALCAARRPPVAPAAPPVSPHRRRAPSGRVELVVVGVSTGGPNALAELLPALPAALPVPVAIVQHMPPTFTRLLAERLDARSALTVREASDGVVPRPGTAWVAPGDAHLVVDGRSLRLDDGPPESSCRPAADPLFRSAASTHGPGVLAVVLTGMGSDGVRGAEAVAAAGGRVLVQDRATSVVWGMPGAVAEAGLADAVLPLPELAAEITRRVCAGRPSLEVLAR